MNTLIQKCVFYLLLLSISLKLSAENPPFVIFSPPKNGTFLLGKTLSLVTGAKAVFYLEDWKLKSSEIVDLVVQESEKGNFVVSHHFSASSLETLAKLGYKIIFIIRDPRDQLISIVNWIREGNWKWMTASNMGNIEQQIEELIYGKLYGQRSFDLYFLNYEKKLKRLPSHALEVIRFENLVGEAGGGSDQAQREEILKLATHLNRHLSPEEVEAIASQIYGATPTFRKGQIGCWRDYFTEKHKCLFKILYNAHLIRLGYEENGEW